MGVNATKFAKVTTTGPIGMIDIPTTWKKFAVAPAGLPHDYHCIFQHPSHPDIAIALNGSGLPIGESGNVLQKLTAEPRSKLIYSDRWQQEPGCSNYDQRHKNAAHTIRSLTGVLEPGMDGDNQFVNGKDPFTHVDKLEVKVINGRAVLSINGYFIDKKTGEPAAYFSNMYTTVKTEHGGVEVHTVSYSARTYQGFSANKIMFQKALSSIHWNSSDD